MRKHSELNINCCIGVYVIFLMLFCVGSSPFMNSSSTDSSVFIVMGRAMLKGKVMYKDLFDHKGLYTYFINCLASFISGHSLIGLFLIETVFMFACARIVFAMFSKYSDIKVSWMGMQIFMYFALNSSVLQNGNLTEEYSLIFQLCSIYLVAIYLDSGNKKHKPVYMFFHGIAASVVLFLRPNMIMMWGAIALLVGIDMLKHKDFSGLFKNIAAGIAGMAAGAIPAIVYAVMNDAVQDTIFAMFRYNMLYTELDWNIKLLITRILLTLKNKTYRYLMVAIFMSVVTMFMKRRVVYYSVMLFMSIISVSLSGRQYGHYYLYLVPFCLPLAHEVAYEIDILDKSSLSLIKYRTATIVIFFLTLLSGHIIGLNSIMNALNMLPDTPGINARQLIKSNEPYYSEDEKILVTGIHYAKIYSILNVIPHEKYFYIPAGRYEDFPDALDSQAASIISGINDVIIITQADREIYPETGRSKEIKQVLESKYNLLFYDEKSNMAMYGRKPD